MRVIFGVQARWYGTGERTRTARKVTAGGIQIVSDGIQSQEEAEIGHGILASRRQSLRRSTRSRAARPPHQSVPSLPLRVLGGIQVEDKRHGTGSHSALRHTIQRRTIQRRSFWTASGIRVLDARDPCSRFHRRAPPRTMRTSQRFSSTGTGPGPIYDAERCGHLRWCAQTQQHSQALYFFHPPERRVDVHLALPLPYPVSAS